MTTVAPAFRMSHAIRRRLNAWRLGIDVAGLAIVNLFNPWLWRWTWLHPVLHIYPVLAICTILSVAPMRLPEAAATRLQQRAAWRWTFRMLPVLASVCAGTALVARTAPLASHPGILTMAGSVLSSYVAEWFWRNVLQVYLRRLHLGRAHAIGAQAALFAISFAIGGKSPSIVAMAFLLGLFNGYLAVRYRTLWPGFAVYAAWRLIFI